jgi:hypothetical protein
VAGDLIPPPSPAGRPSPDPEPADLVAAAAAPGDATLDDASGGPGGPSPFRARFGFLTGALAGAAIAAAVLALSLATTPKAPDDGFAPNWSAWKPTTSQPFNGATEIAKHVERGYRNEKRKRLASVTGGPIAVGQIPLAVVLPTGGDVEVLDGLGVQYTLGGFGKNGVLTGSKPSKARHRLLRREALELALYSFRYLPDVRMVVALLPPAPRPEQIVPKSKRKRKLPRYQSQALFYRPGDLDSQLRVPLRHTIAPKPPPIDRFHGEEARRVDSLTLSNLFEYARTQGQDGRAYLVLERPE